MIQKKGKGQGGQKGGKRKIPTKGKGGQVTTRGKIKMGQALRNPHGEREMR